MLEMTNNIDDNSSHFQTASNNENDIVELHRVNKRPGGVIEERPVQKSRAVEKSKQERKTILAGMRQRAKGVQASINHALIEWGSYNPRFMTSDTEGGKELYDFL